MTTIKVLSIVLVTYLLILPTTFAASYDCNQAKHITEKTICNDNMLWRLDEIFNRTYSLVLSQGEQAGELTSIQKKWLGKRNGCKDNTQCIEQMTQERISFLETTWENNQEKIAQKKVPNHTQKDKPFEGIWTDCSIWQGYEVCTGYKFVQQGQQVCGEWTDWASGVGYDGQLIANTKNTENTASVHSICGTPGSEVKTACLNDQGLAAWEAANRQLHVCHNHLYVGEENPCLAKHEMNDGYRFKPLSEQEYRALTEQAWVKSCLSGEVPN